jgi:hypothetical protein
MILIPRSFVVSKNKVPLFNLGEYKCRFLHWRAVTVCGVRFAIGYSRGFSVWGE